MRFSPTALLFLSLTTPLLAQDHIGFDLGIGSTTGSRSPRLSLINAAT